MVAELCIAAYFVELARGSYYSFKESKRNHRALDRFGDILMRSKTWEELSTNLYADKVNNPELYAKIPQTWMFRMYERLTDRRVRNEA